MRALNLLRSMAPLLKVTELVGLGLFFEQLPIFGFLEPRESPRAGKRVLVRWWDAVSPERLSA